MTLRIINPLPSALRHYEAALVRTLELGGFNSIESIAVSIEDANGGRAARAVGHLRALLRARLAGDPTVVLWPSFGYLELALDALLCGRSSVIFHDARPMRRQFGMEPWQGRLTGRLQSAFRSTEVLVHSKAAEEALVELGWNRPRFLPHPIMPAGDGAAPVDSSARPTCLVLGQYKPTRALDLLERLPVLQPGWSFRIVGRGWPSVAGWDVRAEFVSEAEVQREIECATVLLVPYEHFFQSGVLVRAFELSKPAVTVPHEQTASLYGDAWVGVASEWRAEEVAHAIDRAGNVPPSDVRDLLKRADESSVDAWTTFVSEFAGRQ